MNHAEPRATPALLWLRASLLAAVIVVTSTLAHVSADGLVPGPLGLALLLALTTLVSARFLTRRASPLRLVVLLTGGQAAIHGVLTLVSGHRDAGGHVAAVPMSARATPAFDRVERSGSFFDQMDAAAPLGHGAGQGAGNDLAGALPAAGLGHLVEHVATQSPWMLLAHLAAVVGLGLWLAVGEHALWTVLALSTARLAGHVVHGLRVLLGGCGGLHLERVRRAPSLASTGRCAVPLSHLLHHVVAHRGPPALLAA